MGILDLILKPSEETPQNPVTEQSKVEVKTPVPPIQSVPSQGITTPTINGVADDKFVKMLEGVITENNIPGLDYFEFKQAVENMKALPIDEATKFITVFSILQGQGCTKEILLISIDKYVGLINKEHETFNGELADTFKEKVESKKAKIEQSQQKIVELSNQIKELNDFIITGTQEVQQEEMKLRLAEANFKQSVDKVVSVLTTDKEKITNYIK